MAEFFKYMKEKTRSEDVSEDDIKNLFSGLKGIVYLDTLGDAGKAELDVYALDTGLPIVEIRKIGLEPLRQLLRETLEEAAEG